MPYPALILALVFWLLSFLHVFWAFGGKSGMSKAVPSKDGELLFNPGTAATVVVAVLLAAAGVTAFWRGYFPHTGPKWIPQAGVWLIAVIFAGRAIGDFRYCGFFKRIRDTDFAHNDTFLYSPLCVVISALAVWLSLAY